MLKGARRGYEIRIRFLEQRHYFVTSSRCVSTPLIRTNLEEQQGKNKAKP